MPTSLPESDAVEGTIYERTHEFASLLPEINFLIATAAPIVAIVVNVVRNRSHEDQAEVATVLAKRH